MQGKHESLIRRILRRPAPPPELREQLQANLSLQRDAEHRAASRRRRVYAAAGLLLAAAAFGVWRAVDDGMPAVVVAARQHALDEAGLHEVDVTHLTSWLHAMGAAAPAAEHLLVFKNCLIDGVAAKHLRLRLGDGGTADLMVDPSGTWESLPEVQGRNGWLVAHPRENVSVIAIYTPQYRAEAVQTVETLFPGWRSPADSEKEEEI